MRRMSTLYDSAGLTVAMSQLNSRGDRRGVYDHNIVYGTLEFAFTSSFDGKQERKQAAGAAKFPDDVLILMADSILIDEARTR